jgi:hypothetical protein
MRTDRCDKPTVASRNFAKASKTADRITADTKKNIYLFRLEKNFLIKVQFLFQERFVSGYGVSRKTLVQVKQNVNEKSKQE